MGRTTKSATTSLVLILALGILAPALFHCSPAHAALFTNELDTEILGNETLGDDDWRVVPDSTVRISGQSGRLNGWVRLRDGRTTRTFGFIAVEEARGNRRFVLYDGQDALNQRRPSYIVWIGANGGPCSIRDVANNVDVPVRVIINIRQ